MTKEQEEAIDRLRKITNRQILYGNKYGIVIEEFKKLQEDIETVLSMLKQNSAELAEKSAEIEKKDKMIDLMAEYISDLDIYEDICKKQSDNNCDDINREVECKECIKQYFERKVTYERKRQS